MRVLRYLPLGFVMLVLLASAWLVVSAPPYVWVDTLFDDSYYYLGVARHLSLGEGSMFTPPLRTNGYQPLWLLILTLVSFLVGANRTFLAAGAILVVLLAILSFVWISWRQEEQHWPAALTAICFPMVMLQGMETVLIPPLALLYFRAHGWKRGGLASLIFLARLDALGLIAGREIYEIAVKRRFDLRASAVLAVTVLIYASLNVYLFGSPVPISGLAKSIGNVAGENWPTGFRLLISATPVLVLLSFIWIIEGRFRNPLPIFASTFALGCSASYYGILSGWPTWEWYRWPAALLFYFALIELIHCNSALPRKAGACFLAVMFVMKPFESLDRFKAPSEKNQSWGRTNARMAAIINSSPLRRATFAMGDRAGSFGFLLDDRFRMIQTEGLVGNMTYLDALRRNQGAKFLDDSKTDYLVVDREKYWGNDGTFAVAEPVQGLSARTGVMLLCFPINAEIRSFEFRPARKMFRYSLRVQCSARFTALFNQRLREYGALAASSLSDTSPGFFASFS